MVILYVRDSNTPLTAKDKSDRKSTKKHQS